MFEFVSLSLICVQFLDPKEEYSWAYIDQITIYENRIFSDERKVQVISYYSEELDEPVPWELDNQKITNYQLSDHGMITFSVPYESIYEGAETLEVEITKATVKYVINTETLKYSTDYIPEGDDESSTDYGYCINLEEIPQ